MAKTVIPVKVSIFGKEYPVACPPGEEDGLRKSATRVDEEMRKVRESGKVVGTDRIAVMVALNLAYELLLSKQIMPGTSIDAQSQKRMQKIQEDIESALKLYQDDPAK